MTERHESATTLVVREFVNKMVDPTRLTQPEYERVIDRVLNALPPYAMSRDVIRAEKKRLGASRMTEEPDRTLVCASCFRASCWWNVFPCDENKQSGLVRATEAQLRELNVEHESYYVRLMGVHDNPAEPKLELVA